MKLRDETGSLLISALVFLMVVSLFLTGLGLIIKNESRQQQLLKNNYIAKSMIQLSFNDFTSKELAESSKATYNFNHGTVKVKFLDETTIEFNARLQNNYQFSKQMFITLASDEEEIEELLDGEEKQDYETHRDKGKTNIETVDKPKENIQKSNEFESENLEKSDKDEMLLENIRESDDRSKTSNTE